MADRKAIHQTQYLTFNTRQRHVGQILVSGMTARKTVWHAEPFLMQSVLARRTVSLAAIPII